MGEYLLVQSYVYRYDKQGDTCMSVPTVDAIDGLLAWVSKVEQGAASRNEIRTHQGPYLAAIPTQIAGLEVPVSGELSAAVDEAAVEIARFDEQMGADIAPFAALLLVVTAGALVGASVAQADLNRPGS